MRSLCYAALLAVGPASVIQAGIVQFAFDGRITDVDDTAAPDRFEVGERVTGLLSYDLSSTYYFSRIVYFGSGNDPVYPGGFPTERQGLFIQAVPGGELQLATSRGFIHRQHSGLVSGPGSTLQRGGQPRFSRGELSLFQFVELSQVPTLTGLPVNPFADIANYASGAPWAHLNFDGFDWGQLTLNTAGGGPVLSLADLPLPTDFAGPITGSIGFDDRFTQYNYEPAAQFEVLQLRRVPEPVTALLMAMAALASASPKRRR